MAIAMCDAPVHAYSFLSLIAAPIVFILALRFVAKPAHKVRTALLLFALAAPFSVMSWGYSLCFLNDGLVFDPFHWSGRGDIFDYGICTAATSLTFLGFVATLLALLIKYPFMALKISRLHQSRPIAHDEERPAFETLKRLSKKAGIKTPALHLLETGAPMALTSRIGRVSTIMLSVGLLETMSAEEIEACIGHEHIKNKDEMVKSVVSLLKFATFFNAFSYVVEAMLHRERELLADRTTVLLTRKPGMLASVLAMMEEGKVGLLCSKGTMLTTSSRRGSSLLDKQPSISKRIECLLSHGLESHYNSDF